MKISIKNIAGALLLGSMLPLASCSDFLDKQASNELTEEKTYADWKMFEAFHTDTYNFLLHGANRVGDSWLDAATDLAETSISSSGARVSFNIGNYYAPGGSAELTAPWESRYRAIRKCNRVINDMPKVPVDITRTEEEEAAARATMTAEARQIDSREAVKYTPEREEKGVCRRKRSGAEQAAEVGAQKPCHCCLPTRPIK